MSRFSRWYAGVFAVFAIALNAAWPIMRTDTDLWAHLAVGRYITQERALPTDSYFSFLQPLSHYIDYSWLFQLMVHRVFMLSSYQGLVLLRAGFFAAIVACVAGLLFSKGRLRAGPEGNSRAPGSWPAFLLVVLLIAIMPRCMVLRPHLAEYAAIAFFLFVLEERPSWAPGLPVAAALWVNFHGISYPLLLGICGAYAGEWVMDRNASRLDRRALFWVLASMTAVLLTPRATEVLARPFLPGERLAREVWELSPVSWREVTSYSIEAGCLASGSAFNVILAAGALCAIGTLSARVARPAHLALFAGAIALLAKGERFKYEMALLSLPLLRANPLAYPLRVRKAASAVLTIMALLAMSILSMSYWIRGRPTYPFSEKGLPRGISAFLLQEGGGGTLLHHPELGGYYHWMLFPKYQITMDMQIQTLFSEEDFLRLLQGLRDATYLRPYLKKYKPDFVAVEHARPGFAQSLAQTIGKFPDYVPVFVDDAAVLYANRLQRPQLVRRWELPVDPYAFASLDPKKIRDPSGWAGCEPRFLQRLLKIDPRSLMARSLASRICVDRKDFARAAAHAAVVIQEYPELSAGYRLFAEALDAGGKKRESIEAYRAALRRCEGSEEHYLRRRLGQGR